MTSYEGLRKLTLGDKPVIIKYGDLITIRDDADISHAISLSSLLKLTVNDKITHPVVVPIENLAPRLAGLGEKQTIAAVTIALIDLQDKIGKALQVIQAQHPTTAHYPSDNNSSSQGSNGQNKALGTKNTAQDARSVDTKPIVLTEDILDQLLEPRKSLLTRQASVSSQSSSLQVTRSPPLRAQGTPQPTLSNVSSYLSQPQQPPPQQQQQHQQQQQQLPLAQPWSPQATPVPNGLAQANSGPNPVQQQQQQHQQHDPNQLYQHLQAQHAQSRTQPQPQQPQPQQQQPQQQVQQQQPQVQQQPYPQYGPGNVPQQQVPQQQGQQPQQRQAQYQQQPLQQQQQQPLQQQQQQQQQATPQQQSTQNQLQGQQGPGQQQPQVAPYGQQQATLQQQQQPQQQQQQQQQPGYSQPSYAPNPFIPHQQFANQGPYSPATPHGAPFGRSNSVYQPQGQQGGPRQTMPPQQQQVSNAPVNQAY
ncbi:hypothetical protein BGZ96_010915 [Linnemannia gamsii]|uniref:Uncharacterized protein n=1 Tax=Linnemannia gamsii TaxID=64522 RepID=A0ABQ7JTA3_9FUNG|nr:hypothetical protein BGZ96_010915 [Linnemannia gamsii]